MTLQAIDVHTHILPRTWPDQRARTGYGGWVRLAHEAHGQSRMLIDEREFRVVESDLWDAGRRLEDMDRTGVGVQVLSTVPVMFAYWAPANDALVLARLLNDDIAATVRLRPDRFTGLGTVPLQDPELAIAELERCVGQLGLAGIQIASHVGTRDLDDAMLFPVLQRAAELGAAVFVHPWDMLGAERMARYWLPWLVGMPTECSLAICAVILGGVLERLPALRIGFAHGGGSFAGTFGRIERAFEARPDLVAVSNPVPPRAYLGRFWVDALVHDPQVLRLVVDLFGADRVALGTDYPFPLGESVPGSTIDAMPELTAGIRASLRNGAARSFLGLA